MRIRRLAVVSLLAVVATAPLAAQRTPADSAAVLFAAASRTMQSTDAVSLARAAGLMRQAADQYGAAGRWTTHALALDAAAQIYVKAEKADSAVALLREALEVAARSKTHVLDARLLGDAAGAYASAQRPDSAVAYFRRAVAAGWADKGGGSTLSQVGNAQGDLGRPDSALAYHRRALFAFRAAGKPLNEGVAMNNLALAHYRLGHADSAAYYIAQAAQRLSGNSGTLAVMYGNVGAMWMEQGRADSASVYFRREREAARADRDVRQEARALTHLGDLQFRLARLDSALFYYRQALPLRRATGDREGESVTLGDMGLVHIKLGQPDSARAALERALAIQHDLGIRANEATTLDHLATLAEKSGRPDSAATLLFAALRLEQEGGGGGQASTRNNLGVLLARNGRAAQGLEQMRIALSLARAAGDRRAEAAALGNLAWMLHRAGKGRLREAVAYYDSAAAVVATLGAQAGGDPNRVSLAEDDAELFPSWARAWLARTGDVGAGAALRAGLAAGERGRSQALLDLMRGRAQGATAGADLPAEGDSLVRVARRTVATVLSYLVTADTLFAWVIPPSGDPSVFRTRVDSDTLAALVGALRREMGADEAAAAQHLGGAESRAVRMDPTGGAGTPASDLDLDGPTSAGRLTAVLLPPGLRAALPARGELVVLPAGPLALVPFAALMLDDTVPLGARHALRYAPSLAALAEAERRPSAGRGTAGVAALRASLVVGNPAMPDVGASTGRRLRLSALPAAEREARWVAARLGARSRTGTVASETAVRGLIGAAPVVHFATHGFAYSSDALARSSFVAFAADSANDGLLTAGEVVDELPRLHADLVVLSACQTGLGNLKSAEGTVGLQRAFLAHGARSVLVTLWSISDDATARLMQGFYTHWLGDADRPDKAEALRRAQEALRRTPGFSDPLYWAGFQLVGGS